MTTPPWMIARARAMQPKPIPPRVPGTVCASCEGRPSRTYPYKGQMIVVWVSPACAGTGEGCA